MTGHTEPVWALERLAGADIGRFATASFDGSVRGWDIDQRKCIRCIPAHEGGRVLALHAGREGDSFSENLLSSGSTDRTVKCWDWRDYDRPIAIFPDHHKCVYAVARHGCSVAVGEHAGRLSIWDLRSMRRPKCRANLGMNHAVMCVRFYNEGGSLIYGGKGGGIGRVRIDGEKNSCEMVACQRAHFHGVRSFGDAGRGSVFSSSNDGTCKLWTIESIGRGEDSFEGAAVRSLSDRDIDQWSLLRHRVGAELDLETHLLHTCVTEVSGVGKYGTPLLRPFQIPGIDSNGYGLLATASIDGHVRLYDFSPPSYLKKK